MTPVRTNSGRVRPRLGVVMRTAALAVVTVLGALALSRVVVDSPELTQNAPTVASQSETASVPARSYRHADFSGEPASAEARSIADWAVDSGDNQGMPFVIVDK